MPHTKGLTLGRLTPKIAGSVMPSRQEMPEGTARLLVLTVLVLSATARHAPPCAMLAADATGSQYVTFSGWASMETSMAVYIWCRPVTTEGE